jgi:hypothetical protein
MVYRYRSRARKHQAYNGLKIEIQIRSKLQHAWATAVEIVSTFTGQALKSNIGEESWKRFFKLMGTEMAMREKTPLVPDTPDDPIDFITELRQLVEQLQVDTVLTGWGAGVNIITTSAKGAHTYLLVLDSQKKNIRVHGFQKTLLAQAQQQYLEIEAANVDNPWVQAVLVSVDSVAALRRAYPNYYLDAVAFSEAVERAIA